mmetsp:Transcript_38705/g.81235  ORF Transcript_38705/g.81235 Transcript_38705/m.81235 type:complete len:85 (+) Transcript_38705:162-416(+)
MFGSLRHFQSLGGFPVTSEVVPPLCYSDAAHQSVPCGRCNVHPTNVDIGTGQTTDMYVYTYNHTKDGWFCPGWGEGSTLDTVSA